MPTIPVEVGVRAGEWDQQNVDVTSAAQVIADADTAGFSSPVTAAASGFGTAWRGHLTTLATDAEGFADGLRGSIQAWFDSDVTATDQLFYDLDAQQLHAALVEQR
ncbi:hypothetical protein NODU109028_14585 [Nocardioides dubius]|uniref:Excreted virulence factor EspC, type VII ESX diderm n=1 Tax=Nocardioides dubius TaxID=317019 RepID=A0ABN1U0F0_9ACTN